MDARQPNWSPNGDLILYQKLAGGRWDIWIYNLSSQKESRLTQGKGDKTDASFSPNGNWIVYSSEENDLEFANLFIKPVNSPSSIRLTHFTGYDGAPSWSADGKVIFESFKGDPDNSKGTQIWLIDIDLPVT